MTRIILCIALGALTLSAACESNRSESSPVAESTTNNDPNSATLYVKGMSCPLCANSIDQQLMKVPGVERVKIDLGTGRVVAKLAPTATPTESQFAEAIKRSGFTLDRIEMPAD